MKTMPIHHRKTVDVLYATGKVSSVAAAAGGGYSVCLDNNVVVEVRVSSVIPALALDIVDAKPLSRLRKAGARRLSEIVSEQPCKGLSERDFAEIVSQMAALPPLRGYDVAYEAEVIMGLHDDDPWYAD